MAWNGREPQTPGGDKVRLLYPETSIAPAQELDILLPPAFYVGEWAGRLPTYGPEAPPARRNAFFTAHIAPIVLISPNLKRWVIGQRLARVGGWPVVIVDSNQVEQASEALAALAQAGLSPAAVVMEGAHGDKTAPVSAGQLYDRLNKIYQLEAIPWILYTADFPALSEARTAYDFARLKQRPRLNRFTASLQYNPAADSDYALAQLLEHLIKAQQVKENPL